MDNKFPTNIDSPIAKGGTKWRKLIRLPFLLSTLSFGLLMYASVDAHWSHITNLNKPGENIDFGIWLFCRQRPPKQQQQNSNNCGDSIEYLKMKGETENLLLPDWLSICRLCLFGATTLGFMTAIFTFVLSFRDTVDGLWVLLTQTGSTLFTLSVLFIYTFGRKNYFGTEDDLLEAFGCSYYMAVSSELLCLTNLVIICLNTRLEKIGRMVCLI